MAVTPFTRQHVRCQGDLEAWQGDAPHQAKGGLRLGWYGVGSTRSAPSSLSGTHMAGCSSPLFTGPCTS